DPAGGVLVRGAAQGVLQLLAAHHRAAGHRVGRLRGGCSVRVPRPAAPPRRRAQLINGVVPVRKAVVILGSLAVLAACSGNTTNSASGSIAVEASDDACKVAKTEASTGNLTFEVTNKGSKVTEFYLYAEGDRILGEVENI